ncbi:MAG: hypothetical protein NDJ89_04865 [Oligoflexia bacterium]|nr:hypothetical protein [Oligoflexia bacterium]
MNPRLRNLLPRCSLVLAILAASGGARAGLPSSRSGASGHSAPPWPELALRLTGESEAERKRAIQALRTLPGLEAELRKELPLAEPSTRRFLALDVIAILGLRNLLPELLAASAHDDTGYSYHAINALLDEDSRAQATRIYRERLAERRTSAASKVALLDTLARLAAPLEERLLERLLLEDSSHEVRSAALSYLRHFAVRLRQPDGLVLLEKLLEDTQPYQLRLQALYLFSELPPSIRRARARLLKACAGDPHPEVRAFCAKAGAP